jgi:hypothetical protein
VNTAFVVIGAVLVVAAIAGLALWWLRRRRQTPEEQSFEGTFTFGWEVSSFVPGDGSRTSPRYWLAWTPESRFMEKFKESGYDAAWTPGYGRVWTRFLGVLENGGRGGYGHMGQYDAQVTVTRVIEMGRAEPAER